MTIKPLQLAGRIIMENGGETYRVEETVTRMGRAFGLKNVESFAVPSGVFVSCEKEDGHSRNRRAAGAPPGDQPAARGRGEPDFPAGPRLGRSPRRKPCAPWKKSSIPFPFARGSCAWLRRCPRAGLR